MDNGKMRFIFLTWLMACFSFLLSYAQPSVKASVDRSEILIGDQFKLKIEASFLPEEYKINWPVIADSLAHFEVVDRGKMDSIYNDSRLTGIVQTLTLTSFDSGKWTLPSFLINVALVRGDTTYSLFTDSLPITVSFSTADSTNQVRDIKPIKEVEPTSKLWYWIAAGILLIALVIFIMWFYGYWKKNKLTVPHQTRVSSYDQAIRELEGLKAYNLSVPEEIKTVHSKMGEILKRYLSATQRNNYLNKTTGDVLILLRDLLPDKEMPVKAAACLRCGDAVKFAKYLPPVYESEECLASTREVIQALHQQIIEVKSQETGLKPASETPKL